MQALIRDVRFGARMLLRDPGFAVVAVLTLALVIAANAAIFSVISALLLRPFPYRQPQQLVSLDVKDSTTDYGGTLMRYELLRDKARSFEGVAAWATDNFNLSGVGEAVQVQVARVTPNFFSLLGVKPALGRAFTADEGRPEGQPVVILSSSIWRSRFNSNPGIVGRQVTLDGTPHVVVGVLPAAVPFPFVGAPDIWTPRYFELTLMPAQKLRMGVGYLGLIARLRGGVTIAQGDAELAVLNLQYREQNPAAPDSGPSVQVTAARLRDLVVGDFRAKLWILFGAVAALLLIGCANVASLALSRLLARKRELATRAALGATPGAILRQLLTESILVSVSAGILGTALGWVAVRVFTAWGTSQLPQGVPVTIDFRVLLFTLAITFLTGLLTGIFPAIQLAQLNLNSTLRDEGRGISSGRRRVRLKSLLVISQATLSLTLLIGAGLLVRSFVRLSGVDPGFNPRNVLMMEISLPTERYAKPEQQIAFFDELLLRVTALPGVRDAAISATQPMTVKRISPVLAEGQPGVPLAKRPFVDIEAISSRWFSTMRVPLLRGRAFTAADDRNAPPVVIVNETFARRFWPHDNPIGKHVLIGRRLESAELVGVAADVRNQGLALPSQAQLYLPFSQLPWGDMNLLVRTAVPPLTMASAVRAQVSAIDATQPVNGVQTVNDLLQTSLAQPEFATLLLAIFSATAVGIATIGLYAVLAWAVAQRQQELGIRLALGAQRADILWMVVRQGLRLAATGIVLGLVLGLLLTRFMTSALYATKARDVATFLLAPGLFLACAFLACYLPAHRATKVAPVEALK